MRKLLLCLCASLIFWSSFVLALDRYVATTGNDAGNDCSVILSPCLTLQHAVNESFANDVITVAPGFYGVAGLVSINKTLTILGAQAGIDARTRVGPETVLSNSQGISVSGSNVILDGLVIQDSSVGAFTGYGVWLNPGIDGTLVINNIFQNNIVGLGLANSGATQALVQNNVFRNNNLPGGAFGSGIYTDQFVGGVVSNVLINENLFEDNENVGIGLSSTDTLNPGSNIVITNNEINNTGRGVYIFNTSDSTISDNQITNLNAPTDGGTSVAIGIYGAVSNLSVLRNTLQNGATYGVRLNDFIGASPNTNITIHQNNLVGFATAGLYAQEAPVGPLDFATCNWWGNASGPTNALLNPTGTGDAATGILVAANFDPWLLAPGPSAPCGNNAPTLNKTFSPNVVQIGKASTLKITLGNPNNMSASLTAPLVDNLPSGLKIQNLVNNSCGGVVTAVPGSTSITLTGGSIPAEGFCKVIVKVKAWEEGEFVNTIPAGALQTDKGSNTSPAEDTLTVVCDECSLEL